MLLEDLPPLSALFLPLLALFAGRLLVSRLGGKQRRKLSSTLDMAQSRGLHVQGQVQKEFEEVLKAFM